jgi:hypothetical protein
MVGGHRVKTKPRLPRGTSQSCAGIISKTLPVARINSSHWRRRGVPTFVFRAGYARRPAAASPRWPVDDVIVDVPDIHFRLATNVSLFSNGFQNLPAAPHDTLATRVGIRSALTKPGCRVRYSTTQSKEIISENTKVCDDDHISVTESALLMSGEDGGLLCAKHSS